MLWFVKISDSFFGFSSIYPAGSPHSSRKFAQEFVLYWCAVCREKFAVSIVEFDFLAPQLSTCWWLNGTALITPLLVYVRISGAVCREKAILIRNFHFAGTSPAISSFWAPFFSRFSYHFARVVAVIIQRCVTAVVPLMVAAVEPP